VIANRKAHRKFILCPGGALHMYLALQLSNLHFRSALLQVNFPSALLLINKLKKIVLL
jgi:hypothetical protein